MSFKTADVSNEYKKNEQLRKTDITSLQEWVGKQPHLPQISELQLIIFLHSCFFNIEVTKKTINTYFIAKANSPELFANRDPCSPSLQQAMQIGCYSILPKLTPKGYTIMYFSFLDFNSSKYVFNDGFKLFDMITHLSLTQDGPSAGFVMIIDTKYAQYSHLAKFGLTSVKNIMYYLQEALPVRLKCTHIVNVSPFTEAIFSIVKTFIRKDRMKTVQIHSKSLESLYEFIPKECLPKELGGFLDSIATLHETANKCLMENRECFIQDELQISDESRRITKSKSGNDLGFEGSFKTLDID